MNKVQGTASYNSYDWILNSWNKYWHTIQTWHSFGFWLQVNIWYMDTFWPLFLNGSSQNLQNQSQTFCGDMAACGMISKRFIPFPSCYRPEVRKKKNLFLAPFLAQVTTPNINPSLPFAVWHLTVQFKWDPFNFIWIVIWT